MDIFENIMHWVGERSATEALVWAGIAVAVVITVKLFTRSVRQKFGAWLALPTLEQYWAIHPNCKTDSGPKCYACGSKNFRNTQGDGFAGKDDRTISCRHCGTVLYRIAGEVTNPLLRGILAKQLAEHPEAKNIEDVWRTVQKSASKK